MLEEGGSIGRSWIGALGVIEHNLDVIRCADWIIDLSPDGGDKGGEIVVVGTPETVAEHPTSHTGRYLKQGQGVTWFFIRDLHSSEVFLWVLGS